MKINKYFKDKGIPEEVTNVVWHNVAQEHFEKVRRSWSEIPGINLNK